jgi:hypothetical protein
MNRYEVIRKSIIIETYEIVEILGITKPSYYSKDDANYREVVIEDGRTVEVLEWNHSPLKLGDHVKYDVSIDDFALFDETKVSPDVKLIKL